jgi:hypothetical protein
MYIYICVHNIAFLFKNACPKSILVERPYVFSRGGNVFAWFLVLDAVMVDDTTQYELLNVEQN